MKFVFPLFLPVCLLLVNSEAKTSYEKGIVSNEYFSIDVGEWDETVDITDIGDPLKFPYLMSTVGLRDPVLGTIYIEFDLKSPAFGSGPAGAVDQIHQMHQMNVGLMDESDSESFLTNEEVEVKSAWGINRLESGVNDENQFVSASPNFMDKDGEMKYATLEVHARGAGSYTQYKKLLKTIKFNPDSDVESSSSEESAKTTPVINNNDQASSQSSGAEAKFKKDENLTYHNGNWYFSDWLGFFYDPPTNEQWFFHELLSWIFYVKWDPLNAWFWSSELGWLWTSSELYPYAYKFNTSTWLYVDLKSSSPGKYYDYAAEQWRSFGSSSKSLGISEAVSSESSSISQIMKTSISDKEKDRMIYEIIFFGQ